jgi:phospho-N-acetylmuramoyl-pentapeptide-transferase
MFPILVESLQNRLDEWGLYPLVQLSFQVEFRAFLAALLAFAMVRAAGPRVIGWLRQRKVGDNPEFHNVPLNELMKSKAATPTMGGLLIVGAILATCVLLADFRHSRQVQVALIVMAMLACLGGVDDWLKLNAARRQPGARDGLFPWEKLLFQSGIGALAGWFLFKGAGSVDELVLNLPFQRTYPPTPAMESLVQPPTVAPGVIVLGAGLFTLLVAFMVVGTSNAVNLTDGMDGLATGLMIIAGLMGLAVVWIAISPRASYFLMVPHIPAARELMVVAGAMSGACLGFLWFNCQPASVFMGDTGSLALGGLLAVIFVAVRQEFMLVVVGGVFYLEAVSVLAQVGVFKFTRRLTGTGRRVLRCAPIHHHFQLVGWKETQTVARFWILGVLLAMVAMVLLKVR